MARLRRTAVVNVIHGVLCEDYGPLDPRSIRDELLTEAGIRDVSYETARNRLRIEYDPALVTPERLLVLLCRHALFVEPDAFAEETG
jgi:hypothetical protein